MNSRQRYRLRKWLLGPRRRRALLARIADELEGLRAKRLGYTLALYMNGDTYSANAVGGALGTDIRCDRFERYARMVRHERPYWRPSPARAHLDALAALDVTLKRALALLRG